MKQPSLAEISRRSGKSVATVSKVLRGCPGVTWETRAAVLESFDALEGAQRSGGGEAVAVILPDNPKYFWSRARSAIECAARDGAAVSLRVYSQIDRAGGGDMVGRYLREAADAGARAIILAARPEPRLRETLASLAQHRLVIQLCEYVDVPNTFFVGSDGAEDARLLAKTLCPPADRPLRVGIFSGETSELPAARTDGFLSALPTGTEVFRIERPEASDLFSSHLARAIDAAGVPLDYLFCCDGVTAPACEALHKLRERMCARLVGFEYPQSAEKHMAAGRIAALAVQDPEAQMRTALGFAATYVENGTFPGQKFTRLPSEILRGAEA